MPYTIIYTILSYLPCCLPTVVGWWCFIPTLEGINDETAQPKFLPRTSPLSKNMITDPVRDVLSEWRSAGLKQRLNFRHLVPSGASGTDDVQTAFRVVLKNYASVYSVMFLKIILPSGRLVNYTQWLSIEVYFSNGIWSHIETPSLFLTFSLFFSLDVLFILPIEQRIITIAKKKKQFVKFLNK